ncbi:MAG TPA: beta-N-acetylhexosaminidase [Alphaproteobacteria bacterium]|nr:beta-N-acetylhexosaminidase [Alphaproteobacteria bacterium]
MKSFIIALCLVAATVSAADAQKPAVIPLPQEMTLESGYFTLTADTPIWTDKASRKTAAFLTARLRSSTGFLFASRGKPFTGSETANGIVLTCRNADPQLGLEGYELTINSNSVVLRAPTQAGLFYGVQTLLQLFPPEIFSSNVVANVDWRVPCLHIRDWPRFQWRGLMLDVSRHYFNKSEIESLLDAMALHKLNTFHWHLTDDQGWRIQIKKYPRLTEVGAWRKGVGFGLASNSTTAYGPDGRYGGFYTPKDIHEVVAYATARHITVVPEIEMPGHSTAALAAYPQYSCTGGPFTIRADAGIFNGIYNPANDQTFVFLDGILSGVFRMFPGKYVHVGGDEVPKATWHNNPECQALMKREGLKDEKELQSWFTRRIERYVSSRGRTLVGWSEILQGGIARNATVMDWTGGATEAARAGHDVVMSPTGYCYFDFYQSTNHSAEPPAATWAPSLLLSRVYSFDPMPTNLPEQFQSHILGTQGNLWTEHVPNLNHAEYMIFPRECAIAEVAWSPKSSRDWDDFIRRLRVHAQRLDELGINYRHASITTPE